MRFHLPHAARRALLTASAAVWWLGVGGLAQAQAPVQTAAAPADVVVRFSHVVTDDTPKGVMARRFQALVQARSEGRVQVQVYPRAQLYGDRDEIEALQLGAVEMLAPSLSKFGRIGFPEFELFDLPFLFKDDDDVRRITQGPLGRRLLHNLRRQHMVGLGFLDNGFKHMSAHRPMFQPADFKGMRMRIQASRTIAVQMRALGARPVELPFSDTRRALGARVVDGTENPVSNFWTQRMHEVQPHLTLTQHGYLGYAVVANAHFWQGLNDAQRDLLQTALDDALQEANELAAGQNAQALAEVKASGLTQVHALTPAQTRALKAATQPAYADLARRIGKAWIDTAQEALAKP